MKAKKVILAAETEGMKKELEEFTKLPVELFPHPIEAKNLSTSAKIAPELITVPCPGFARHEKGSDFLLSAIGRLNSEDSLDRFHFILQWPRPFLLPDGTKLKPDKEFENSGHITLYNEPFGPNLLIKVHTFALPSFGSSPEQLSQYLAEFGYGEEPLGDMKSHLGEYYHALYTVS